MSMEHKAFLFDWCSFERELLSILLEALGSGQTGSLIHFIERNRDRCKDPYEGLPLQTSWQASLETGDVQELADFALATYYDPVEDRGLGPQWLEVEAELAPRTQKALLGQTIGGPNHLFDPGRMGAYFQSPQRAAASLEVLRSDIGEAVGEFLRLLEDAVRQERGVYVTF